MGVRKLFKTGVRKLFVFVNYFCHNGRNSLRTQIVYEHQDVKSNFWGFVNYLGVRKLFVFVNYLKQG